MLKGESMALPSGADLKALFDRVQLLLEQARLRGETAQRAVAAAIDGVTEALRAAGAQPGTTPQLDALEKLDDKTREALGTKLEGLAHGLENALNEAGPRDPHSLMYDEYASNGWVVALVGLGIAGCIVTIFMVYTIWPRATSGLGQEGAVAEKVAAQIRKEFAVTAKSAPAAATTEAQAPPVGKGGAGGTEVDRASASSGTAALATPAKSATSPVSERAVGEEPCDQRRCPPGESTVLLTVVLLGALGGFLHWTSSLAQFVGNRELKRSWIAYYLLMPVEGAALAPISYLLLRVGVLSPGAGVAPGCFRSRP